MVNGKLNVQGGVVDRFQASSDRQVTVTLVVLTQPQPFDLAPVIAVQLTTPTGEMRQIALEVPKESLGGEVGFVIAPLHIPLPVDGKYTLSLSTGGGSPLTLPLTVFSR